MKTKWMAPAVAGLMTGISSLSHAAPLSFEERASLAKQRSAQPEGAAYEPKLYSAIGQAINACVPVGPISPDNIGTFTLVAWVAPDGKQTGVAFQPETKVSRCFGEKVSPITLPPPPKASAEDPGYPIEIDMRITP